MKGTPARCRSTLCRPSRRPSPSLTPQSPRGAPGSTPRRAPPWLLEICCPSPAPGPPCEGRHRFEWPSVGHCEHQQPSNCLNIILAMAKNVASTAVAVAVAAAAAPAHSAAAVVEVAASEAREQQSAASAAREQQSAAVKVEAVAAVRWE